MTPRPIRRDFHRSNETCTDEVDLNDILVAIALGQKRSTVVRHRMRGFCGLAYKVGDYSTT